MLARRRVHSSLGQGKSVGGCAPNIPFLIFSPPSCFWTAIFEVNVANLLRRTELGRARDSHREKARERRSLSDESAGPSPLTAIESTFSSVPTTRTTMFLSRHWKTPKILLSLFALEFALTIAALAFFGIASPDTYRTALWFEGAQHGWNSNPNEVLYAAANYRSLTVPMVWTQLYDLVSQSNPALSHIVRN